MEFTAGATWLESRPNASQSNIYFRMASKRRAYEIEPYSIIDLFGDMGGLLNIVFAVGAVLTAAEVHKAFSKSLLRDVYQVQGYSRD